MRVLWPCSVPWSSTPSPAPAKFPSPTQFSFPSPLHVTPTPLSVASWTTYLQLPVDSPPHAFRLLMPSDSSPSSPTLSLFLSMCVGGVPDQLTPKRISPT